jgi:Tfp pilus assembly protein PilZ
MSLISDLLFNFGTHEIMGTVNNKGKKYNIVIKKLFDAILKLNETQQMQVMMYVEELLAENKRTFVRKACDIPINYATRNRVYSDKIADISKNGLFIETKTPLNVGEVIMLSFNMQGYDRPFKIKGKVVHSNQRGIGVEFRENYLYISEMLGALVDRIKGNMPYSNKYGVSVGFGEVKPYIGEMLAVLSERIKR